MVHTAPSRVRATRMRACLRLGALLTTVLSLAAIAGPASAHRSSHRSARHAQRTAADRAAARARRARRGQTGAERRFVHVSRLRAQTLRRARHHRRHHAHHHARHRSRHHARRHAVRGCRGAHARLGHARPAAIRHAVVCLIDRERTGRGLPTLSGNARLNSSAQRWTDAMVREHAFSHGSDFSARITAVGFDWSRVGENIAAGYTTPAGAVRAWMRSTGHCQNILNPMFREAGTGAARAGRGTWTLDFGLLMNQRPASGDFGPASGCPYSS